MDPRREKGYHREEVLVEEQVMRVDRNGNGDGDGEKEMDNLELQFDVELKGGEKLMECSGFT